MKMILILILLLFALGGSLGQVALADEDFSIQIVGGVYKNQVGGEEADEGFEKILTEKLAKSAASICTKHLGYHTRVEAVGSVSRHQGDHGEISWSQEFECSNFLYDNPGEAIPLAIRNLDTYSSVNKKVLEKIGIELLFDHLIQVILGRYLFLEEQKTAALNFIINNFRERDLEPFVTLVVHALKMGDLYIEDLAIYRYAYSVIYLDKKFGSIKSFAVEKINEAHSNGKIDQEFYDEFMRVLESE